MNQRQITIAVTEDDPAVRDGLRLILERARYRTIVHDRPQEVLDEASEIPDLYIIDRQLSGIDGVDLCEHLKARPDTASVPVIIISATPHVARLASIAGASAFLEKPFRSSELLSLIRRCLPETPGN